MLTHRKKKVIGGNQMILGSNWWRKTKVGNKLYLLAKFLDGLRHRTSILFNSVK